LSILAVGDQLSGELLLGYGQSWASGSGTSTCFTWSCGGNGTDGFCRFRVFNVLLKGVLVIAKICFLSHTFFPLSKFHSYDDLYLIIMLSILFLVKYVFVFINISIFYFSHFKKFLQLLVFIKFLITTFVLYF